MVAESELTLERGAPAPDFDLPGADGRRYRLDDFSSMAGLLVVFTCNHCPYAVAKIPLLNELSADYDDVAVVGINPNDADQYPDDSFDRMVKLVEDGTVAYDAYLRDESQAVATAYGAACTPDPYLFERTDDGFRLVYHGRLDDAQNPDDEPSRIVIREAIDAVRAGEPVELDVVPSRGCSIKWRS